MTTLDQPSRGPRPGSITWRWSNPRGTAVESCAGVCVSDAQRSEEEENGQAHLLATGSRSSTRSRGRSKDPLEPFGCPCGCQSHLLRVVHRDGLLHPVVVLYRMSQLDVADELLHQHVGYPDGATTSLLGRR